MKRILLFSLSLLTFSLQVAATSLENISFSDLSTTLQLYVGDQMAIEVIYTPENATNKTVSWNSSNPEVVTVNDQGVINALAYGTVRVSATAEDGGHTAYVNIAVYNDIRVTGVTLNETQVRMDHLDEYQLTATLSPSNARYKEVTWNSSHPEIATVDENGLITSYVNGTTTITVTTIDGGFTVQCELTVTDPQFTEGVFFVNEDWFGHRPGSVNFLYDDGRWKYDIYTLVNPENILGQTSQYGMIYADKFFICSKQGIRFVVCNAATMKMEAEFENFTDEDGTIRSGDSRACIGVNNEKVYVSSSNGIWIYDIVEKRFKGQIKDTENSTGTLYEYQVGMMAQSGGRIFAVHQYDGLLVIDPEKDELETTITGPVINGKVQGFGTIALGRDGNLWATAGSSSSELDEDGYDILVKIDPFTLECEEMPIPAGRGIGTGWGAWRAGTFFASNNYNRLYWYKNSNIQVYDMDTGETNEIFSTKEYDDKGWNVYSAFRVHPVTEDIYIALFRNYSSNIYRTICVNGVTGELMGEYDMTRQYWFPAIPVFPDNYAPEIIEQPVRQITSTEKMVIPIEELVTDRDHLTAGIVATITGISNPDFLEAEIVRYNLIISPKESVTGNCVVSIEFNSNGKSVTTNLTFTTDDPSQIENPLTFVSPSFNMQGKTLHIMDGTDYFITLYNMDGRYMESIQITNDNQTHELPYPAGLYILKGTNGKQMIQYKIVVR